MRRILELWRKADATPSVTDTEEEVLRVLSLDRAALLVAIETETVIGSIIATFDGWRGNIYRLAVAIDSRRKGVATHLVREAEDLLSAWGARRVSALVEHDHDWAISFWRAQGYEHDSRMSRFVRHVPDDPATEVGERTKAEA